MKKLAVLFLAAFMIFGFAACGNKNKSGNDCDCGGSGWEKGTIYGTYTLSQLNYMSEQEIKSLSGKYLQHFRVPLSGCFDKKRKVLHTRQSRNAEFLFRQQMGNERERQIVWAFDHDAGHERKLPILRRLSSGGLC